MTDKTMVFEVDIDTTAQDDWDMQRLGKSQQLKVGVSIGYGASARSQADQR